MLVINKMSPRCVQRQRYRKEAGGAGKDGPPLTIKLESDVKRLKCDLQLSRNRENELRDQIVSYMSSEYRGHRTCFILFYYRGMIL